MLKKFFSKVFTTERIIWLILVVAGVLGVLFFMNRSNNYEEKYDNAVQNNKAYVLQLDKEKAQSNVFKLTVDQLSYYNDSIVTALNNMRKELNIKDKQLKQLRTQYLKISILIWILLLVMDGLVQNYQCHIQI